MPKKILKGEVVSNKMKNTVVVAVKQRLPHPIYHKLVARTKKFYAHTEGKFAVGQVVEIEESRPISKMKRWRVVGEKLK